MSQSRIFNILIGLLFLCAIAAGLAYALASIEKMLPDPAENKELIESLKEDNRRIQEKIDSLAVSAAAQKSSIIRLTNKINKLSYEIERGAIDTANAAELQRMFARRYPE
jgi:hypothetical protein